MNGLNCESEKRSKRTVIYCAITSVVSIILTLIICLVILFGIPGSFDLLLLDYYADRFHYSLGDDGNLENGILSGYVSELNDKYAYFLDKTESEKRVDKLKGISQGLGMYVTKHPDEESILVTDVFDDSPASKAGIEKFDLIISVDGNSVSEIGYSKAIELFNKELGSEISVTLKREENIFNLTAIYSDITTQTVFYQKTSDCGYIKIISFNSATVEQFIAAIDKTIEDKCRGLIFDLRGNGGGTLSSVEQMLDYILPEGDLIYTRDKKGNTKVIAYSDSNEIDIPMAMLTDNRTASAAEIFASNIREFNKGCLIGEITYGKGVMQETFSLFGGKSVVFTVSEVLTHNQTEYHGKGVTPDIEIKLSDDELKYLNLYPIEKDRVVMTAVGWINDEQSE